MIHGTLVGMDIIICVDGGDYQFPFSEYLAIGAELEHRRQMYYDHVQPSRAIYVLVKEAHCVLHGFNLYLGDFL